MMWKIRECFTRESLNILEEFLSVDITLPNRTTLVPFHIIRRRLTSTTSLFVPNALKHLTNASTRVSFQLCMAIT
ncbi:hypothetical protein M513_06254 [Trichuris suis]|uniref:Uncharacterized protein n=1 Tax=Trichuris suis TaxID=68888 RepID=A0A085M6U8_9BILA|nr:hypothetical protein M513_06254 [Trichuris suis]